MNGAEQLEKWPVYREMLATHEMFRRCGFPAEEIFAFIGLNSAMILKTQGLEFSVSFPALPMPIEEFRDGWQAICEQVRELPQPLLDRCVVEWKSKYSLPDMLLAMRTKGISFSTPSPDVHGWVH